MVKVLKIVDRVASVLGIVAGANWVLFAFGNNAISFLLGSGALAVTTYIVAGVATVYVGIKQATYAFK